MSVRDSKSGPSLQAVTKAMKTLSRISRQKSCAVCGMEITQADPALRVNGMHYHVNCVHFRPRRWLTG